MNKNKFYASINNLFLNGLNGKQIKAELDEVLGDSSPSHAAFANWAAKFKRGRASIEDAPRSGSSKKATIVYTIERVDEIVMNDRRIKLREIEEKVVYEPFTLHLISTFGIENA